MDGLCRLTADAGEIYFRRNSGWQIVEENYSCKKNRRVINGKARGNFLCETGVWFADIGRICVGRSGDSLDICGVTKVSRTASEQASGGRTSPEYLCIP